MVGKGLQMLPPQKARLSLSGVKVEVEGGVGVSREGERGKDLGEGGKVKGEG